MLHRSLTATHWRGLAVAALALIAAGTSCRETPAAPAKPPYIAILANFTTAPGVSVKGPFRYTIEELSGTLNISRTLVGQRGDTIVTAVPPASYVVEILDVPSTCTVRDGPKRLITLLETDNTATLRYNINCIPSLTVEVLMDGYELDTRLVYRVSGPGGERLGFVDLTGPDSNNVRGDTIIFQGLPAGEYEVSLSDISSGCIFSGQGPSERRVNLVAGGGEAVSFRLRCSEQAARPRILSFVSTYHDSTSGFVLRVYDRDRDVTTYTWDLTDCRGNSLLPAGARTRRGLDAGRTQRADTLVIVGAFESTLADSVVRRGCTAIQVEDFAANTSEFLEQRNAAYRAGSPPREGAFNAVLRGTESIGTTLSASDPDGDFAGMFAAIRVRDGVLGPFDGSADIGILSVPGFLDTRVPDIALGGRVKWDDVYAVIVYLIDHAGNFKRLEDPNLSR